MNETVEQLTTGATAHWCITVCAWHCTQFEKCYGVRCAWVCRPTNGSPNCFLVSTTAVVSSVVSWMLINISSAPFDVLSMTQCTQECVWAMRRPPRCRWTFANIIACRYIMRFIMTDGNEWNGKWETSFVSRKKQVLSITMNRVVGRARW